MPGSIDYDAVAGDLGTAEFLSGEWLMLKSDNGSLPNHPALHYAGSIAGRGSNVIKVRFAGLNGYDPMAPAGDGSIVPATQLAVDHALITVTRQSLVRVRTDMVEMISPDIAGIPRLALDAMASYATRMTDILCGIVPTFVATAGQSGIDLATSDVLASIGAAKGLGANGPWMGILHTQQWADFIVDAGLNTGGVLQFLQATAEMIQLRTSAFQGTFLGADWFVSSRVPLANGGANRAGGLFANGAIGWGDGDYGAPRDPNNQIVIGGKIRVDLGREGDAAQDRISQNAMLGASKMLEYGVTLASDA